MNPEIQIHDPWLRRAEFPSEELAATVTARIAAEQDFRNDWNRLSQQHLSEGKAAVFMGPDGFRLRIFPIISEPELQVVSPTPPTILVETVASTAVQAAVAQAA